MGDSSVKMAAKVENVSVTKKQCKTENIKVAPFNPVIESLCVEKHQLEQSNLKKASKHSLLKGKNASKTKRIGKMSAHQ